MDSTGIEEGQLERAGFGKQRRNLLITSVLLMSILWLGVDFSKLKTIRIFSESLAIERPEAIFYIAWLAWIYFLIRYIAFHLEYQKPDEKFLFVIANRLKNAHREITVSELKKKGITFPEYNLNCIRTSFLGNISHIQLKLGSSSKWGEAEKLSINPTKTWFIRLRVIIKVLFGVAGTSEYYLPYFIAVLPLIVLVKTECFHWIS